MKLKQLVMKRYATKEFDGKVIPQDKVNELFELIRMAPTSFNIQPWKVKVVTDKMTKEKLFPVSWNQKQITTCSHLLVFCADNDILGLVDKLEKEMIAAGASPESIKGYVQMMRDFAKGLTPDQALVWAQKQVYIALENAMLGATALGFDSCPMEGFNSAEYHKILKLPKNLVASVLCPIGYAADKPLPKLRFKKEDLFF
ncbi:NAD(P)H-dependent oxidoreductase [Candidatus Woesearchaeota archaeon]|nr:NAD(P)H-dependent oxidoreductase [Candidatus Woesearchaeota archaeon]